MTSNDAPDLTALVASTNQMVAEADLIETWTAEAHEEIRAAGAQGMTWDEWNDQREADIAYAESYGETGWNLPFRRWADEDQDRRAGGGQERPA